MIMPPVVSEAEPVVSDALSLVSVLGPVSSVPSVTDVLSPVIVSPLPSSLAIPDSAEAVLVSDPSVAWPVSEFTLSADVSESSVGLVAQVSDDRASAMQPMAASVTRNEGDGVTDARQYTPANTACGSPRLRRNHDPCSWFGRTERRATVWA